MNAATGSFARKQPRFFYGWIIVGISLLSMGFHNAARFSFAIFQVRDPANHFALFLYGFAAAIARNVSA